MFFFDDTPHTSPSLGEQSVPSAESSGRTESEVEFEQLDRNLEVTSRNLWLALFAIIFFLTVLILWSFFGYISVYVEGRGVVMSDKGVFVAQTSYKGILQITHIKVGDFVKEGTVLANVYNPELELGLETAQIRETIARQDYTRLKNLVDQEDQARKYALERDLTATEYNLSELVEELPTYQNSYDSKKKLYKEGLIRLSDLTEAEDALLSKKTTIEQLKAKIAASKAELVKGYRTEEIQSKEDALRQAREEFDKLNIQKKFSTITSPADGLILALLRQEGTFIDVGTSVVWLEHSTAGKKNKHVFYAYVPIEMGKKIPMGAPVYIDISTVNSQEYGFIEGYVTDISPYAISPDDLVNIIHNTGLVQYLMGGQPALIQVIITPKENPANPSGYSWTSGKGPDVEITTGTVCRIMATVERVHPIYYAFPVWTLKNLGLTGNSDEIKTTGSKEK